MQYPVILEAAEEGGFVVHIPLIPEAVTQGDNEEEALEMALDALVSSLYFYYKDQRLIPVPALIPNGSKIVELSPMHAVRVFFHNEMIRQNLTIRELAQKVDKAWLCGCKDITDLISFDPSSGEWNQLAKALGYQLNIIFTPINLDEHYQSSSVNH